MQMNDSVLSYLYEGASYQITCFLFTPSDFIVGAISEQSSMQSAHLNWLHLGPDHFDFRIAFVPGLSKERKLVDLEHSTRSSAWVVTALLLFFLLWLVNYLQRSDAKFRSLSNL